MRRTRALYAHAAAFVLVFTTRSAFALRPDNDGERGVECTFSMGYGSFTDNTTRLFQNAGTGPGVGMDPAFSGSAGFHFGVGYRLHPLLSAGLDASVQMLDGVAVHTGAAQYPTTALAYSVGIYARFYPAPLFNGALSEPRATFDGVIDGRRVDPFISVGFEFLQTLTRTETAPPTPYFAVWNRHSLGVPIGAGFDVRLLPGLAVGVSARVTPWIGGGVDESMHILDLHGNDISPPPTQYTSPSDLNFAWWVGIDARYTFTF